MYHSVFTFGLVRDILELLNKSEGEKNMKEPDERTDDITEKVEDHEKRSNSLVDPEEASNLVRDASRLVREASGLVRNASGLVR